MAADRQLPCDDDWIAGWSDGLNWRLVSSSGRVNPFSVVDLAASNITLVCRLSTSIESWWYEGPAYNLIWLRVKKAWPPLFYTSISPGSYHLSKLENLTIAWPPALLQLRPFEGSMTLVELKTLTSTRSCSALGRPSHHQVYVIGS